jgi:hypothetical protein
LRGKRDARAFVEDKKNPERPLLPRPSLALRPAPAMKAPENYLRPGKRFIKARALLVIRHFDSSKTAARRKKVAGAAIRSYNARHLPRSRWRDRSVAQPGSAPRSGRGGRRFESSHSDHYLRINRLISIHYKSTISVVPELALRSGGACRPSSFLRQGRRRQICSFPRSRCRCQSHQHFGRLANLRHGQRSDYSRAANCPSAEPCRWRATRLVPFSRHQHPRRRAV